MAAKRFEGITTSVASGCCCVEMAEGALLALCTMLDSLSRAGRVDVVDRFRDISGRHRARSKVWEHQKDISNLGTERPNAEHVLRLGLWLTTLPAEIMMQDLHFESINGGRMKMRTKNFDSYPCNLHKDAIRDTD